VKRGTTPHQKNTVNKLKKQNMKTQNDQTFSGRDCGCVLDCSADSADTLNQRTVEFAIEYGMQLRDDDKKLLARFDYDVAKEDDSQFLSELGDEAVDYLNGLDLPSHCSFYFEDNSLFLAPNVDGAREDVGFVSHSDRNHTDECDPDDAGYPAADYRGEWLHVNDHGNCTLYVRNDDGNDVEIWAIV
jgi:hypothetical protein